MHIIRASFLHCEGHAYLEFVTDKGTAYCSPPKQIFLEHGFIPLWGPDVEGGPVESEDGQLPPAPADGRWSTMKIEHCTYHPVPVHIACQLMAGELTEGPLEVPTLEEAEKWKWEIVDGEVVKKLR